MAHRSGYPRGTGKIKRVMGEFKRGILRSSSGARVTSHRQATAIALSEQRRLEQKIRRVKARGGY